MAVALRSCFCSAWCLEVIVDLLQYLSLYNVSLSIGIDHNQTLTTSVLDCIYRAHKAQHAPIMMILPSSAIAYLNLTIC